MRNDGDIPSPVRLKKLLPMLVVSKLEVMNTDNDGMGSQLEGLQEQCTSWTSQRQRRDQCHKENAVEKMHCAHKNLLCWYPWWSRSEGREAPKTQKGIAWERVTIGEEEDVERGKFWKRKGFLC